MTGDSVHHAPHWIAAQSVEEASGRAGLDAPAFAHLVYGELVKQFGRDTHLILGAWDQLPESVRETFVGAMAVIHGQIFPHGPPASDRYASAQAREALPAG